MLTATLWFYGNPKAVTEGCVPIMLAALSVALHMFYIIFGHKFRWTLYTFKKFMNIK